MQAGKGRDRLTRMAKTRPENLPDEMLVIAAILGDLRSFDALVLRYRAAAYRVAQSIAGNELAEDAVQESLSQYNKILARLGEIDPDIKNVFEPLAEGSSLMTVAMACRQIVSYYEDEVKVEQEGWPRGFAAGFKVPGCGAGVDFNVEEVGNWIRDWMQELGRRERERRAEHKHSG